MRPAGGLCPRATRTAGLPTHGTASRHITHLCLGLGRRVPALPSLGFSLRSKGREVGSAPSSAWPGLTLQMLLVVAPSLCSRTSGAGPRSSGRCRYSCTSRSRQRWPRTLEETGVGAGAARAGGRGQGYLGGTGRDAQGQEGQGAPPADGSPAPAAPEGQPLVPPPGDGAGASRHAATVPVAPLLDAARQVCCHLPNALVVAVAAAEQQGQPGLQQAAACGAPVLAPGLRLRQDQLHQADALGSPHPQHQLLPPLLQPGSQSAPGETGRARVPVSPPCRQGHRHLPEGCAGPVPARSAVCGCRPRGSPGRPKGQTWREQGALAGLEARLLSDTE